MSHRPSDAELAGLLGNARGLLRLQAELGVTGLDVPDQILQKRAPPPAQSRAAGPASAAPANRANKSPQSAPEPRAAVPLAVTDPAAGLVAISEEIGDCTRCKLSGGRTTIGGEKFRTGANGAPILEAGRAWVECKLVETLEQGDHSIFLGQVVDAGVHADVDGRADADTLVLGDLGEKTFYGG